MVKREKKDEFDQKLLEIARVSRVTKGGKRLSFRAIMAVGNHRGKVGIGVGKGADVSLAIEKSIRDAKKRLIFVQMVNDTIPHEVYAKYVSSKVFIKPAPRGSGLIAGGVMRSIADLVGISNVSAKFFGSTNKLNSARAVMIALRKLKEARPGHKKVSQPAQPTEKQEQKQEPVKEKARPTPVRHKTEAIKTPAKSKIAHPKHSAAKPVAHKK